MNIHTEPGRKVVFSHPENGYPSDQETANRRLTVGATYTVASIEIADRHSQVFLAEFPGIPFNTVLFADLPI